MPEKRLTSPTHSEGGRKNHVENTFWIRQGNSELKSTEYYLVVLGKPKSDVEGEKKKKNIGSRGLKK
jgi:hypothetical protein